jgi:hypothetical protein
MSQIQSSPPICPKCHKAMKYMLTTGERQRVLRCADCSQLDPMLDTETQGWLKGELSGLQAREPVKFKT